MLRSGEQFKIFEHIVLVIAIFPPDAIALRDRAVRVFPNATVDELPIRARAAFACDCFRLVSDLAPKIAVTIHLDCADRNPLPLSSSGALSFLELRRGHPSGTPARAAHTLVRGDVAFRIAMRSAGDAQGVTEDFILFRKVSCTLVKAERRRALVGGEFAAADYFRDFLGREERIGLAEKLVVSLRPELPTTVTKRLAKFEDSRSTANRFRGTAKATVEFLLRRRRIELPQPRILTRCPWRSAHSVSRLNLVSADRAGIVRHVAVAAGPLNREHRPKHISIANPVGCRGDRNTQYEPYPLRRYGGNRHYAFSPGPWNCVIRERERRAHAKNVAHTPTLASSRR